VQIINFSLFAKLNFYFIRYKGEILLLQKNETPVTFL